MTTVTFNFTGASQTFTVPAGGVVGGTITFDVEGAAGAASGLGVGGLGARVTGTLAVTAGETIQVNVGGAGSGSLAGFNGGASGGTQSGKANLAGGGGGGASDLRQGGTALANRVVVAGGGGGASDVRSGGAGGQSGAAGGGTGAGGGGTPGAGGAGGSGNAAGASGTNANGGVGGNAAVGGAGGDGGGGGGGGNGGGGGGGGLNAGGSGGGGGASSGPQGSVFTSGFRAGAGTVTITYVPITQPTVTATSPSNAAFAAVVLKVAGASATESHFWDEMAIFPAALGVSGPLPGFPGLTMPQVSVQIALASNPLDSPQVWTDVTKYGHWSIDTSQGRMHELTRVEAGKVTLVCDNTQRVFDPDNTVGPLAPNLDVGKRLRVQAKWNLLTVNQASLETDTTGWVAATNCSIAQGTVGLDGTHSLKMTATAAGDMTATTLTGTSGVPVRPNQAHTAMGNPQLGSTARPCSVGIAWYDSGGIQIGATVFGPAVTDGATWLSTGVAWDAGDPIDIGQWFIESYDQNTPAGSRASTTIRGSDYLKIPNLGTIQAPYAATVLQDGPPTAYYRLQDKINPNLTNVPLIDWSGNGLTGQASQVTTISTGIVSPLHNFEPASAGVTIAPVSVAGDSWVVTGSLPAIGTSPFAIECWVNLQNTTTDTFIASSTSNTVTGAQIDVVFHKAAGITGTIEFDVIPPGGGGFATSSSLSSINDGQWHHLYLVRGSAAILIYVDGTLVANTAATAGNVTVTGLFFGPITLGKTYQLAEPAMTVGSPILTAAQVLTHAGQTTGWQLETGGPRVNHVLGAIGIPAGDISVEAGATSLQALTGPTNALAHIQAVQQTENGLFFADVHGKLVFYGRGHLVTSTLSTVSQATFGDRPDLGELVFLPVPQYGRDDLDLWTTVEQQRQNGALLRAINKTARTKYVNRTLTAPTSLATSDADTQKSVNWLLTFYQAPVTRVRTISLDALSNPAALFPQMLRRALWDLVTVKKTPPPFGTGPRISQIALIEHINHHITPGYWKTDFAISPAPQTTY